MIWRNPYEPVERASDFPRFCGACGREMIPDDHVIGYDRHSGAPRLAAAVRCPKGRFNTRHEAFIVAPRPPAAPVR